VGPSTDGHSDFRHYAWMQTCLKMLLTFHSYTFKITNHIKLKTKTHRQYVFFIIA